MWVKQLEHESAEQNRTEELYFLTEKKKTDFKNCYIFWIIFTITNESLIDKRHQPVWIKMVEKDHRIAIFQYLLSFYILLFHSLI